jgi:CRP-like cAMP-binding protein
MYGCKRSTTVFSENYSTLAKLPQEKFHEIIQKYPKLDTQMKLQIKNYKDNHRLFILKALNKVPHFEFLKDDDRNAL